MSYIVVNDTNIFIDLYKLDLLKELFSLPFEIHTVDFVMEELLDEHQREAVESYHAKGQLTVHVFTPNEVNDIALLQSMARGNLSFTDCATWYYAKANNYTLVTGDGQLRRKALASSVPVKGMLFLFDKFVEENILTPRQAALKLGELLKINTRLPLGEVSSRISKWQD